MALFSSAPELTIGNPERPKAGGGSSAVGVQTSIQIFTRSSDVYMVSMSTKDTGASTAHLPLVAKRGAPWVLQDPTGFQNLEDVYGIDLQHQAQCQAGSMFHIVGCTASPFFLWYMPYDCSTDTFGTPVAPYDTGGGTTSQPSAYPLIGALS